MANHYEVPSWAGKAPTGQHLDVTKDEKMIQKFMIDEKKCYLFGRNAHLNDVCIDHGSCSRVHAALVYHKHLNISYLVDLGSTHGTFIGSLQIEAHKPTQLQLNTTFHFGASTRYYTLRERPTGGTRNSSIMEDIPMNDSGEGALLGLPENQTELDNLTEYNTAHNRRISMMGITDDTNLKKNDKNKRKRRGVTFNDEEIVINPEDIDPSVGRFRNLIQTTVLPTKKMRFDHHIVMPSQSTSSAVAELAKHMNNPAATFSLAHNLYQDLPPSVSDNGEHGSKSDTESVTASKLGIMLPNPAPEVAPTHEIFVAAAPSPFSTSPTKLTGANVSADDIDPRSNEPRKKKYAKEAWPGRKPLLASF